MLRLAAALAIAVSTPADLLTWPDLTSRPRPAASATVAYGPDEMQKVDVWLPAGKEPFPVVLMVHGGCWQTSIADRSLMNWIADDLRNSGIAVWNIDYRGVDRAGGGYPGTFADAAAAADRLTGDARKYHLDLRRIVAVGHSAGGHLALWLAARRKLPRNSPLASRRPLRIDHVVSLGGLPDLELTAARADNGCGTEVVGKLVGSGRADLYADTSVTRLLPIGVPQTLVNGDKDRIIPIDFASDYVAKARAAGDTITLTVPQDTGHVELIAPETAAWRVARADILVALKRR